LPRQTLHLRITLNGDHDKPLIKIENVGQTFNTKSGFHRAARHHLTVRQGRVRHADRPLGLRQVTLLNLIAGLTTAHQGVLLCDNREIAGPGPERAVVFQNHSLLPWLTCFENVIPRRSSACSAARRARRS
jgi:nitrate/nitrite transport system ATP-binding protein